MDCKPLPIMPANASSQSPKSPEVSPENPLNSGKQTGLFRSSALAKSASPDHLDQLVKIVPPLGWLMIWTIIGILAAALAWGFFGEIPDTVQGRGILLRGGRLESVTASGPGLISELLVKRGDFIEQGTAVAKVRQPTLIAQIANQQNTVDDLTNQLRQVQTSSEAQLASQTTFYTKQKNSVETSIADYQRQSESLNKVVAAQKTLLQEGLIPMTTLLQSQTQLDTTNLNILDAQNQLQQIETNLITAKASADQSIDSARLSLQQAVATLNNYKAQLSEDAQVYNQTAGRVVSIDVAIGTGVQAGTQVVVLEKTEEPMAAVLFFTPGMGKSIQPGMTAQISPAMAPVDQYGYLVGRVTQVGDVPATEGSIMALLANTSVINFVSDDGPVLEVSVLADEDPNTPSGFRWSSSKGPSFQIPSGTTCEARVVVRQTRPIELVIPLLKKFFGVDS